MNLTIAIQKLNTLPLLRFPKLLNRILYQRPRENRLVARSLHELLHVDDLGQQSWLKSFVVHSRCRLGCRVTKLGMKVLFNLISIFDIYKRLVVVRAVQEGGDFRDVDIVRVETETRMVIFGQVSDREGGMGNTR